MPSERSVRTDNPEPSAASTHSWLGPLLLLPPDRNARERPSGAQAGRRGRPWSVAIARGGWLPSVAASHNVDFRTALAPLGWSHSTTTYATCLPSGASAGALAQRIAAMSSGRIARLSDAGPLAP